MRRATPSDRAEDTSPLPGLRDDRRVPSAQSPPQLNLSPSLRDVQSRQQALLRGPVEPKQYTAVLFTKRCAKAGIEVSMGSVGDCYDNAVCETFHATIKKEKIYRQSWPTRAAARAAIFEYIEGWYNPRRRHSTLAYLSPIEFERHHAELAQPALEASISANGSVASISPRASDGLTTRRISTVGVDFAADGSDLSRERPRRFQPVPLRPRRTAVKGRTATGGLSARSQGTSSLIQTSTTTAKTCRPNRGRSTWELCLSLHAVRDRLDHLEGKLGVPTAADAIARALRESI